mmetsp:Transcript_20868/g.40810  ORF Transcript_20868/g.40810 Transcript_20868/m.40810 type:complete len:209 (+) Transcript_20868:103-729(+)|eukprot:CAMPEP_0172662094 /NCGR_PEP_ID=MMETSP1074-20121228/5148_1 /TAXON_ID=2916 /ORGANISM="Ceratium fusus, Strain PA161109" /LENGTH=208 /DNA_ID=CAMNT_0013477965 /DNA_START=106 /DNA_END=732 /DNA_ORIENTATION=+
MPKYQTTSQQAAAKFGNPQRPGAFQQHQDVQGLALMGILTLDEIRNPAFHAELYRCKSHALERDLMQIQAATHEVMHARLQNQEAMRKIAMESSMIVKLLSMPEVQHHEKFKHLTKLLPHYQRLHNEATEVMGRPLFDVLRNEMPGAVKAMDLKDLETPVPTLQTNGKPVHYQVPSQSASRRRRNRQRPVEQDMQPSMSRAAKSASVP